MMDWDNQHMDGGWSIVMMLSVLVLVLVMSVAVVWFCRTSRTTTATTEPSSGSVTSSAEQILAARLARGEIDADDYQSRLAAMRPPR